MLIDALSHVESFETILRKFKCVWPIWPNFHVLVKNPEPSLEIQLLFVRHVVNYVD